MPFQTFPAIPSPTLHSNTKSSKPHFLGRGEGPGDWWECGLGERYAGEEDFCATSTGH